MSNSANTPTTIGNERELPTLDDIINYVNESGAHESYAAKIRFAHQKARDPQIRKELWEILIYLEKPDEATSTAELIQFMDCITRLRDMWVITDGLDEALRRWENLREAELHPETVSLRVVPFHGELCKGVIGVTKGRMGDVVANLLVEELKEI